MLKVVPDPFRIIGLIFLRRFYHGMHSRAGTRLLCGDEYPAHQVFYAFFIDRTEVTQGQWKAVTGSNPSSLFVPEQIVQLKE
ncbi:MAG: hypothetical protein IPL27_26610 [Lewinellaceae bacterium]|nr:hypothetical protein [Lewinellaceae bacterium]